jgi:hypothetical protein
MLKKNSGVIWIQTITIFWEKQHYDSYIGKLVIAIFDFPQKCHEIRILLNIGK